MSLEFPMPDNTILRHEWGSGVPRTRDFAFDTVKHVYVTVTDTDTCTTREQCSQILMEVQKRHKETMPDINYNFMVGGDGNLYEGRGWLEEPDVDETHKPKDGIMYHFAYIGRKGHQPSEAEAAKLDEWISFGQDYGMIGRNINFITDM